MKIKYTIRNADQKNCLINACRKSAWVVEKSTERNGRIQFNEEDGSWFFDDKVKVYVHFTDKTDLLSISDFFEQYDFYHHQ